MEERYQGKSKLSIVHKFWQQALKMCILFKFLSEKTEDIFTTLKMVNPMETLVLLSGWKSLTIYPLFS